MLTLLLPLLATLVATFVILARTRPGATDKRLTRLPVRVRATPPIVRRNRRSSN